MATLKISNNKKIERLRQRRKSKVRREKNFIGDILTKCEAGKISLALSWEEGEENVGSTFH